jgi:glycosyltransferase involved in cell wall biosynthesis
MTDATSQQSASPTLSVVIPTKDMAGFLPRLWESLCATGVTARALEVMFVDDASQDTTAETLAQLRAGPDGDKLVIERLPANRGRYWARYLGARRARGERVLFVDSRITLADGFGAALERAGAQYENVIGCVDIDVQRSVFRLYWERSHRRIFARHYRDTHRPLTLTPANFDRYLKGTSVFLCSRELFLRTCAKFEATGLLNDDTYLMKEMVQDAPLVIHPELRVQWTPRESYGQFLLRLWERGPSFVEYHVFEHHGTFFWVVMAGLTSIALWLVLLMAAPLLAAQLALGALLLALASTAAFAHTPLELVRLAPLHLGVLAVFGTGIVRGLGVNAARKFGELVRKRKATAL